MTKQSLIVFNLPILFDILNEIKENFNFNFDLYKLDKKKDLNHINELSYGNFLIVTSFDDKDNFLNNVLVIDNLPLKINEIVEKLNINFLKKKFNNQSEIKINNFELDINSRTISNSGKKIKLTEREIEIILYLKNSKESQPIENLQKEVWGHNSNLETHTVETHIYRLRKKIYETFKNNDFIISTKNGYKLS
tara:strand:- start:205 stop:783 length:579 start_codon:yes stop_codon:yes gene_type:complete